jgi:hypothetical protein
MTLSKLRSNTLKTLYAYHIPNDIEQFYNFVNLLLTKGYRGYLFENVLYRILPENTEILDRKNIAISSVT